MLQTNTYCSAYISRLSRLAGHSTEVLCRIVFECVDYRNIADFIKETRFNNQLFGQRRSQP